MPCPTPVFELKIPAYQRANCPRNSKNLEQTECLKSLLEDNTVFVRLMEREISLDTVRARNSSVSCLSSKVFVRPPQKILSPLKLRS